jgi:SAM-dependent methyltransferase
LDVGCGYGYLLERLRGRFDLHGIDVSEHAIIESRRRLPEGAVEQADVQEAIPFPGPFQAVLAVNVIEHLLDPEAAVRNIRDVLAPGGVAIIHVPTIDNSISRLIYRLSYERDPTHAYRPSAAAVRDLFASLGLRLLWDSQSPHVPRWLWNTLRWHPAHLAIYRRDRGVGRPVVSRR